MSAKKKLPQLLGLKANSHQIIFAVSMTPVSRLPRVNKDIETLRKNLEEKNAEISKINRDLDRLRSMLLELKSRVHFCGGHKTNRPD
jgi:hypothetical protein